MKANAGVDDERAREICSSLREDGFIWTVRGKTSPGIPSFFSYCRAKQQKNKPAEPSG
ncbi:MAG: hypothetical protein ISN26_01175 [Betaproteobacteria bacterium AqS2]|uniref:Uncharacterized protein n=1 Tax=Candidatus Amphirhobacter heronislandensis TaxID=1732024 RepID=A0A930UGA9_9GAMM|nr:hypothetical protein [Betaproteobacteria bacterium AqS2]